MVALKRCGATQAMLITSIYVKRNIDYYVTDDGNIKTYDKGSYNLDMVKDAAVFGIHFNGDSYKRVTGLNFPMGAINVDASNPIFKSTNKIYIKELSTLKIQSPAKAVLTKEGNIIMAVAKYNKGTVVVLGDPWLYNEYTDGRKLPKEYGNYKAAKDLVKWCIKQ